jgi:polysaccharide export outer membrane protein
MTIPVLVVSGVLLLVAPTAAAAQSGNGGAGSTTPAAASVSKDYQLAIGDKLRIEVYKDPQLSQSLQIRPDGKITLPLVGDVMAAGQTALNLRDTLAKSLREYISNPVVTVIVVETVPPSVYVMGEVNTPGTIPLKDEITVLQALAMAGGFKEFANKKDIRILRRGASGTETIRFNYQDAIDGDPMPVFLRPGDTIVVK